MKKQIKRKIRNINEATLQRLFRNIIGWDEMQEQIDTVNYLLNQYLDIRNIPKATGLLRQVQLADAELLRIVTNLLTKNDLVYWLDYGTLLGAVRHGGFIPWDDDLDIAMPRQDYDKALRILPGELKQYGIKCQPAGPGRFWIHIWDAGLMLDIVPLDNVAAGSVSGRDELAKKILKYKRYYNKHRNKSDDFYLERRTEMVGEYVLEKPLWFHNIEYSTDLNIYEDNTIFPLRKMDFEGYSFFVPNDPHGYMTPWYGDYMSFPKKGILHHKGTGEGIYNNSLRKGVNIDELIERLQSIEP